MKDVNVAFCFDHNLYRQAGVAIASLLNYANNKVGYNIYCLCSSDVTERDKGEILKVVKQQSNVSTIEFILIEDFFDSSFETRGISKAAYFRLLLHKFLPNVDKIIYSDVDVLFKTDLSEIFEVELGDNLLGVVKATAINVSENFDNFLNKYAYWKNDLSDVKGKYFNSGFLLMNLKKIREEKIENKWIEMATQAFFFQDQDILNITCKNRVVFLPPKYITVVYALDSVYTKLVEEGVFNGSEVQDLFDNPAILHWAGEKPWDNKDVTFANEWWFFVKKNTSWYSYFFAVNADQERGLIYDKPNIISVVFFSHSGTLGGAERSLIDLVCGLRNMGILCSVILPSDGSLALAFESAGIATYVVPSGYSWWAFDEAVSAKEREISIWKSSQSLENEILPIVKMINPNIIYSQTIVSPWGAICASRLNIPHALGVREYGILDHNLFFHFGFNESMRAIYMDSKIIFANTDDVKNTVFAEFNKNPEFKSKCLTVGSSIKIPTEILEFSSVNKLMKLSKKQKTKILILGNISKGKGQIDAIRAVAKLKIEGYNLQLTLMGRINYDYNVMIQRAIKDNNVADIVNVCEYSNDGIKEMIKNDIILSCSKKEALGRVLFEAALLERPFVYSNSGGSKEIFLDGIHGLGYEPGEYKELASKIADTINDYDATLLRVKNVKKFVLDNFNDENYINKQYDELVSCFQKHEDNKMKSEIMPLLSRINMNNITDYLQREILSREEEIKQKDKVFKEKEAIIQQKELIIQQKEFELREIRTSLRWKVPNYFYKLYKNKVKKFIPGFIFKLKDISVFLLFKILINVRRLNLKKIKNSIIQSDPYITIGIASYNHSKYLKQCIESALNQDYDKYDIVIIDDNSSDPQNKEILKNYESNKKITIIYKDNNGGISASLNDQVVNSNGDWIAFMDCDDYLPVDALSKMAKHIKSYPKKRLIFSNRIEVDENNNVLQKVWFGHRTLSKNVFHELMKGMASSHLKLIHKDAFLKVGLFDDRFGGTHDYDMYLKVAFYMPEAFGYIDEYLYYHRIHSSQNTKVESEKHEKNVQKMRDEFRFREQIYSGELDELVSIVILNFNRGDRLKKSIEKILKHARSIKKEIIVWDNASNDQKTIDFLKELEKKDGVQIVFSRKNLRCSGGRREAAKLAQGKYIVFLDNDIEIQDGTIEELVIRINEDEKIAGACCRLLFPGEKIQYNGGSYTISGKFISFKLLDGGKSINDLTSMLKKDCDWIPGGATIFRKNLFTEIEHDVEYINAFEDNDFSFAITNKLGLKVVNCPTSVATHYHVKFELSNKSGTREYLQVRSNNEAFVKSWKHFYDKWQFIIKDDFVLGLAGLVGKKEEDIENYLKNKK